MASGLQLIYPARSMAQYLIHYTMSSISSHFLSRDTRLLGQTEQILRQNIYTLSQMHQPAYNSC